jgi:hypothetical protein
LIRLGKVDVRQTLHQLERVSAISFVRLVLLNALLVYLSTEKWRTVDAALRSPADSVPSRIASFFVSSTGMALGLILPVQLGMTAARTIGTHTHGRALRRGTGGTLVEQGFDLLVVLFFTAASMATWLSRGNGITWVVSSAIAIGAALLLVEPAIRMMNWLACYASTNLSHQSATESRSQMRNRVSRVLRDLSDLRHSRLIDARLVRWLLILSAARFCVVVLMAYQNSEAIVAHIPLWRMGASVPFATFANAIGITPGGIGVNELASVAALRLFGTPLTIASQWALANRLLGTGSCFAVAACASFLLGAEKIIASTTRPIGSTKDGGCN